MTRATTERPRASTAPSAQPASPRDIEARAGETSAAATPEDEEMRCTLCGLRACWTAP